MWAGRWRHLHGERELWVGVVQQDDGFRDAHALAHADLVEERRLLDVHGHVDDGDVGVVELVEGVRLAVVELLKPDVVQLRLEAATTFGRVTHAAALKHNSHASNHTGHRL